MPKSKAFFKALGFSHNPQFIDDTATCVVISKTTSVMLLTHAKFRQFTPKAIRDTTQAAEVLVNLSCESRQEVDDLVAKAIGAGGTTYDKTEDFGLMYTQFRRPRRPRLGPPSPKRAAAEFLISEKSGA